MPSSIFPTQFSLSWLALSILLLILSIGIYHSLYTFILKKILQHLYFSTKHFQSSLNRSFFYLLLTSIPMLILGIISLVYNQSLVGLEISMEMDQINLLFVSGYICWIEESRHTPIRGIILIRDVIFAITINILLIDMFYLGTISLDYSAAAISLFLIYYFVNAYFQAIQTFFMRIFGLKESNSYNAKFLLTSKHSISDFLQIKDIIQRKKQQIQQQLKDYQQILINLQDNEQDQQILKNFSKLFLPIKKAYQIKQSLDNELILGQIEQSWEDGSNHSSSSESQVSQSENNGYQNSPTWNQSSDGLGHFLKTNTNDFIINDQDGQQLSLFDNIIKFVFYPIYLASLAEGRLFYLVGYVSLALLIAAMFGVSNAATYLCEHMGNLSVVTIIVASAFIYPTIKYYVEISRQDDYDFSNIFIQCFIFKNAIMSLLFIVYGLIINDQVWSDPGSINVQIVRIIMFGVYLIFMAVNRFATRFSNFKFFCAFLIVDWVAKIISQSVFNSIFQSQQ